MPDTMTTTEIRLAKIVEEKGTGPEPVIPILPIGTVIPVPIA